MRVLCVCPVCVSRLILRESGQARYLHSAVLVSGTMLVFGGNTHNDTSLSNGAKCFSADFLAYDIGRVAEHWHASGTRSLLHSLSPLDPNMRERRGAAHRFFFNSRSRFR